MLALYSIGNLLKYPFCPTIRQCLVRLADGESGPDMVTGAEEEKTVCDKRQLIISHSDLLKALGMVNFILSSWFRY